MANTPNTHADEFDIQADGKVRIIIDGTNYLLRRPKIGEARVLEEAIKDVGTREQEEIEAAKKEDRPRESFESDVLDWWRLVVETLEKNDKRLPDDNDELPMWLTNNQLITNIELGWRTVPWGPGGQPAQNLVKEAGAQVSSLTDKLRQAN